MVQSHSLDEELVPGEIWWPRGQGLAREVLKVEIHDSGERLVRYRTKHGDFAITERDFRFWISRLSASVRSL